MLHLAPQGWLRPQRHHFLVKRPWRPFPECRVLGCNARLITRYHGLSTGPFPHGALYWHHVSVDVIWSWRAPCHGIQPALSERRPVGNAPRTCAGAGCPQEERAAPEGQVGERGDAHVQPPSPGTAHFGSASPSPHPSFSGNSSGTPLLGWEPELWGRLREAAASSCCRGLKALSHSPPLLWGRSQRGTK